VKEKREERRKRNMGKTAKKKRNSKRVWKKRVLEENPSSFKG